MSSKHFISISISLLFERPKRHTKGANSCLEWPRNVKFQKNFKACLLGVGVLRTNFHTIEKHSNAIGLTMNRTEKLIKSEKLENSKEKQGFNKGCDKLKQSDFVSSSHLKPLDTVV
jgi:hypothetical protein